MVDKEKTHPYFSSPDFLNNYLGSFEIKDRPKRSIYRFIKDEKRLPDYTPRDLLHTKLFSSNIETLDQNDLSDENLHEMNSGKRSSNKYSHIQAKVQCHRREERSVSPGIPLRKKSPTQAKPPSIKTALCKPTQKPPKLNEIKPKVDSLSNINYVPGGGESKVFTERLTFRQKAEPRTDTHGIEMYAHLPEEFQEIARRLARQDSQLKKQNRGRSASRSHSSSFAVSSRQSSVSPERGRSRTRRTSRKLTPGNSISDIFAKVNSNKQLGSPVKPTRPSLSRSSSIRSIPNTPNLYKQHPASAIRSEKSPTASPARSPGRTTESKTLLLNYNEQLNTLKNRNKVSTVAKADRMPSPVMKLYQFTTQNDSFGSLISN